MAKPKTSHDDSTHPADGSAEPILAVPERRSRALGQRLVGYRAVAHLVYQAPTPTGDRKVAPHVGGEEPLTDIPEEDVARFLAAGAIEPVMGPLED